MRLHKIAVAIIMSSCLSIFAQAPTQISPYDPNGTFAGTLKLQPTGDGVHMAVLETYSYADASGHTLTADPGFTTDGASIPRALWTIVGSPFTGKYVGAAVIHDVGCDTHKYSWQVTHRMFYTAMLALGVSDDYAKILYWGVRVGGPKWSSEPIQANSLDELRREAQRQTGKPLNEASVTQAGPHGHAGGGTIYKATVQIPIPNPNTLSDDDAKTIATYVKSHESLETGAVTVDDIDRVTPLTGPLPSNAIPK